LAKFAKVSPAKTTIICTVAVLALAPWAELSWYQGAKESVVTLNTAAISANIASPMKTKLQPPTLLDIGWTREC
jgi:hypothetical protein